MGGAEAQRAVNMLSSTHNAATGRKGAWRDRQARDRYTERQKEEGKRKTTEKHWLLCISLNILMGTQPETERGAYGILEVTSDL